MWQSIEYKDDMLEEIINMTVEEYGPENDISQKEFIEHEYFQNPMGHAYMKLAFDEENDVLAGQYIVIPMKVKVDQQEYPVILSLNTLTRKEYRGQKIFVSLAEEVYGECSNKGYHFCYGAPNPNSHPGFIKKLGFQDMGVMPLFLKILHPSLLVKQKFGSTILSTVARPFNVFFRKLKKTEEILTTIRIDENNVDLMDDFWQSISKKYCVMGVRDSKYIKWRYLDMPKREYSIWAVCDDNLVMGYIIGRVTEVAGMKCGMIVDFLVSEKKSQVAAILLQKLQQEFYEQEVGLMGCLMQKHCEEARWLKECGFFKCPKFAEPQPFPIIYRNLMQGDQTIQADDLKNWFFTMGDYDVI